VYDIVFLSYHEPNAAEHWELVYSRFPRARRVHGISGIVGAHHLAASLCKTRYFWVIDADNIIHDDFDFSFHWNRRERQDRVAVWKARNNINGLEYGYGGIKLLPRRAVLDVSDKVVDFTTSISDHFHPMDEVASTTVINSSPFEAWKAGFRECVKLSSGIIKNGKTDENESRLAHWMSIGADEDHGQHCINGANLGYKYGTEHANDPAALANINNWEWLREKFTND
jgi:hypothetical protein